MIISNQSFFDLPILQYISNTIWKMKIIQFKIFRKEYLLSFCWNFFLLVSMNLLKNFWKIFFNLLQNNWLLLSCPLVQLLPMLTAECKNTSTLQVAAPLPPKTSSASYYHLLTGGRELLQVVGLLEAASLHHHQHKISDRRTTKEVTRITRSLSWSKIKRRD